MTLPNSLLAYQDCTELLDAAIADPLGVRYAVDGDYGQALHFQSRIHYARRLHREENTKIYNEGDPLFGRSVYDAVVVRIRQIDGTFYLYFERNDQVRGEIESLSALEGEPDTPTETPKTDGVISRRV